MQESLHHGLDGCDDGEQAVAALHPLSQEVRIPTFTLRG
jgi:hypothetical protein